MKKERNVRKLEGTFSESRKEEGKKKERRRRKEEGKEKSDPFNICV